MGQAVLGRIDAVYANVAVANYQLQKMGKAGSLVFDPDLPHTRDSYFLSTPAHPEVIAEFNAWMSENAALIQSLKDEFKVEDGVR